MASKCTHGGLRRAEIRGSCAALSNGLSSVHSGTGAWVSAGASAGFGFPFRRGPGRQLLLLRGDRRTRTANSYFEMLGYGGILVKSRACGLR